MKLLFVCHNPPAPANDGGSIDMLGMAEALFNLGHDVHLLYTAKSDAEVVDEERLRSCSSQLSKVQRNLGLAVALSSQPYQIASRKALTTLHFEESYDAVIASDHCSGVFLNPSLVAGKRILRRNNDEALYAFRMGKNATNPLERIFFAKEALLFGRWYRKCDKNVDQIWYVSTEELMHFSELHEKIYRIDEKPAAILIPSALGSRNISSVSSKPYSRRRVLYFGSMTVSTNRQSVDWYVEHVHPLVLAQIPDYELVVAGRTDGGRWEEGHARATTYQFIPNPVDAEEIYEPGGIFIDPKAHDAGVKLKILEAIRRGFPVVCSPASLFGSGLEAGVGAKVALSAEEFAKSVINLLKNHEEAKEIVSKGQKALENKFNILRDISSALSKI